MHMAGGPGQLVRCSHSGQFIHFGGRGQQPLHCLGFSGGPLYPTAPQFNVSTGPRRCALRQMERLQSRIPRFAGLASQTCIVCRRRLTPVAPLTLRSPGADLALLRSYCGHLWFRVLRGEAYISYVLRPAGRTLTAAPVAAQVSRKERVQDKHKSLRRKVRPFC